MEWPETNLLICLFDRVPEEGCFPNGITLIPPEHQLRFELGIKITPDCLEMEWKKVYADPNCTQDYKKQ